MSNGDRRHSTIGSSECKISISLQSIEGTGWNLTFYESMPDLTKVLSGRKVTKIEISGDKQTCCWNFYKRVYYGTPLGHLEPGITVEPGTENRFVSIERTDCKRKHGISLGMAKRVTRHK